MIWTVILKNGNSFVVYGSSHDIHECYNAVEARGLPLEDVAGIVTGLHEVRVPSFATKPKAKQRAKARRASIEAPEILSANAKLGNDPIEW